MSGNNRDLTTEQWIKQWDDSPIELLSITFDQIDFRRSEEVQNRWNVKIDEEHAGHIVEWLQDATHTVPPIVVNAIGGRYHIVDGIHRGHGTQEAGRSSIDAYVVRVDQDKFEAMVLAANARNAKGLTPKERDHLAMKLAERTDITIAAAQFGMRPDHLGRIIRAHNGRQKFEQATRGDSSDTRLSDRKAEMINRLDEDQIERIGADNILNATNNEIEQTVQSITSLPAMQRHEQAIREGGRLAQARQDKKTPLGREKAQRKVSVSLMRSKLNEVVKYLQENPAALDDKAMAASLARLSGIVANHASAQHAA